jgi:hypothetical protein
LIEISSPPPIRGCVGRHHLIFKPSINVGDTGNRHAIAGKFARLERERAMYDLVTSAFTVTLAAVSMSETPQNTLLALR